MFNHCIDASDKAPDVSARLRLLTTFATRFIFDKVQRGLFEQHKLLFSFMLATATARAAGQVTQVFPCLAYCDLQQCQGKIKCACSIHCVLQIISCHDTAVLTY